VAGIERAYLLGSPEQCLVQLAAQLLACEWPGLVAAVMVQLRRPEHSSSGPRDRCSTRTVEPPLLLRLWPLTLVKVCRQGTEPRSGLGANDAIRVPPPAALLSLSTKYCAS
jgi:hypothetical protein